MGIKIGWIWGRAELGVLKTPIVEDVPRRNDRRPRFPAWNRRDDTHMSHARPTTWIMWTTQLHCRLWNKPRSGHHVNACSGGNCTVRAIASVDIISLAPITSPCTSSSYWYSQKVPYRAHMWLCGATASIVESYTCVWGSHNLQSLAHLKGPINEFLSSILDGLISCQGSWSLAWSDQVWFGYSFRLVQLDQTGSARLDWFRLGRSPSVVSTILHFSSWARELKTWRLDDSTLKTWRLDDWTTRHQKTSQLDDLGDRTFSTVSLLEKRQSPWTSWAQWAPGYWQNWTQTNIEDSATEKICHSSLVC